MKKCPYCAEEIQEDAVVCRYCGRELVHKVTPKEEALLSGTASLEKAIGEFVARGWVLISRTENMAQMRKPKRFNWYWFILWLGIGMIVFALPVILYLIYYAVKKDEVVTLSINDKGEILINGRLPPPPTLALQAKPLIPQDQAAIEASTRKALVIGLIVAALIGMAFFCAIASAYWWVIRSGGL